MIGDCTTNLCGNTQTTTAQNVTLNSAGTVDVSGTVDFTGSDITNTGTFDVKDATVTGGTIDNTTTGNINLSGNNTISSDVINNGNTNVSSGTTTITGNISGNGSLTKDVSGELITTGSNTYSGDTSVSSSTLAAGAANTLSPNSNFTIDANGILDLAGYDQTIASLTNAGTVRLGKDQAGTTLTVNGDYVGKDGVLALNTVLGDDNSTTDKLVVGGNVSGNTTVQVTNVGGLGAQTTGNGIEIVGVGGTSTNDAFTLAGTHVDAGAYEYYLYKGNATGTGEDWYLRSQAQNNATAYRKEVPLYSAIGAQLREADRLMLANMHKRIGETPSVDDRAAWGRVISGRSKIEQNGAANAQTSGNYTGLQLGSDLWRSHSWRLGAYAGYLQGDLDVDGNAGGVNGSVGSNTTKSYFLGAYGNRTWDDGTYVDLVLQGGRHRVTVEPNNGNNSKLKGNGVTASVEVGKPFALGNSNWKIEPQAQIMHQWLDVDDSDISGATTVSHDHNNAWLFRVGARIQGEYAVGQGKMEPYARVNFYYSPNGGDRTTFTTSSSANTLSSGGHHGSTELALGTTYALNDAVKIYGELGHTWSNGGGTHNSAPINGSVGVKISW